MKRSSLKWLTLGFLLIYIPAHAEGVLEAIKSKLSAEPPYTVVDTRYEVGYTVGIPSLHWVDNTQLLFTGGTKDEARGKLHLWNDKTKSVQRYAEAESACFSNGFIRYQVRMDQVARKRIVREGPFGSEKEIEEPLLSKEELRKMPRVHSNFTCKVHLRSELAPPAPNTRNVAVLRDGDGYLDLGPWDIDTKERKTFPRNLTLYQGKTGKAIQLPMTWEEDIASYDVFYSEYRSAYIVHPKKPRGAPLELNIQWPKDQPLIVYLLWPNGQTETVSIPYWPTEYLSRPQPVKSGWIFGGGNFYKASGLYLFDGKTVSEIDTGQVWGTAVSPDGCKAAVAIQNKHLEGGAPINLKIFNFCKGGK